MMKTFGKIKIGILFLGLLLGVQVNAVTSASDIDATIELSKSVGNWWASLKEPKPKSVTVLSVSTSDNLQPSFQGMTESLVLREIAEQSSTTTVNCQECKVPRVQLKGEKLIVTKGAPDGKALTEIAKDLEVESFLRVELIKTFFKMEMTVSAIRAGSNEVFAAKSFSVGNITAKDSSLRLGFAGQAAFEIVPAFDYSKESSYAVPFGFELSWQEHIGAYTRVGINAGALFNGAAGIFAYGMTHLGWKFNIGQSGIAFSPQLELGLGYKIFTQKIVEEIRKNVQSMAEPLKGVDSWFGSIGVATGINFDIDLGRFFYIGSRNLIFIPLAERDKSKLSFYPGIHLGFHLGS